MDGSAADRMRRRQRAPGRSGTSQTALPAAAVNGPPSILKGKAPVPPSVLNSRMTGSPPFPSADQVILTCSPIRRHSPPSGEMMAMLGGWMEKSPAEMAPASGTERLWRRSRQLGEGVAGTANRYSPELGRSAARARGNADGEPSVL